MPPRPRHKRLGAEGDAIFAITFALEQMLAPGQPAQAAGAAPLARQARIAALDRRHQIILWSCVAAPIILGLLAFAIVTARDITTFEFGPSKARASHR